MSRISIDPAVCFAKPCIKGTRIWVSLILDCSANGMTEAEILTEYPQLSREDVLAAIAYGAEAARERTILVPPGSGCVKFKLDENVGTRGVQLLAEAGHDVAAVYDLAPGGASDEHLLEVCIREKRTLTTLDHDFGRSSFFHQRRPTESLFWRFQIVQTKTP